MSARKKVTLGHGNGIRCRDCGCAHLDVVYIERKTDHVQRRKQCRNCGWRVTTIEREKIPDGAEK